MIDLGLDQSKIREIKYEVEEGKIIVFKLNNSVLEDVEIIEEEIKEETTQEEPVDEQKEEEKKEFNLNEIMLTTKPKQLNDYEPFSCLKNEKGMQETLEASRHKQWKEDVINNPSKPTETGNALIKEDKSNLKESITGYKNRNNYTKSNLAEPEEIKVFNFKQKHRDLNEDIRFRDKHEKKLVKDLVNAKKLIDNYTTKMSAVEKERFADRVRDKYFKLDPNDEYSKIKSLGSIDTSKTEFVEFLKDKPYMPAISKEFLEKNGMKHVGTMKVETESGKIIEFKPNKDEEKTDE